MIPPSPVCVRSILTRTAGRERGTSTMPGPGHFAAPGAQPRSASTAAHERPFFGRVESLRGLGAVAVAAYHFSGCMLQAVTPMPRGPSDGLGMLQHAVRQLGLALLPPHAALMIFFVITGFGLRLSLGYVPQKAPTAAAQFLLARLF